jgi:hypothetical protein
MWPPDEKSRKPYALPGHGRSNMNAAMGDTGTGNDMRNKFRIFETERLPSLPLRI